MSLLTPWLWTFGLQNCERITFCCLKPLSLQYFVTAAWETNIVPFLAHPPFDVGFPKHLVLGFFLFLCIASSLGDHLYIYASAVAVNPSFQSLTQTWLPQGSLLQQSLLESTHSPWHASLPGPTLPVNCYPLPECSCWPERRRVKPSRSHPPTMMGGRWRRDSPASSAHSDLGHLSEAPAD